MQFKYFKPVFFFSHLKKSIKYSLPLLPDDLLGLFQNSIDKFMLQIYKSINYVGLYDISLKVADISKFFFDAASKVWNPFFLKESEKTDGKSKKKLVLRYNIYLFFMNSLTFIVCIFSDELIKILLDKNFHSVNIYVPICCLSVLIAHSFSTVALPQLQYAKKLTIIPVSSFFTMIINLTLNFLLIPKYGVFGAVLATVFSNTFWSIFIFYNSQKNYYLPFNHLFLYGNIIFFLIFLIPVYFLLIIKIFWFYKLIIKIIITLIYVILINKFFKLKIFKYLKIYKSKLI